ncbi:MAG: hypothetical protein GY835_03000, partial [bacterium]|nr:hypothetical protein [bacterium]
VDLGTGVPGNLGAALQTTFGDAFNALPEAVRGTAMMTNNGGTITDLDVAGWMIGGSGISAYIGLGLDTGSIVVPLDTNDRPMADMLADTDVQAELAGFGVTNVDVGVVAYEPTINDFLKAAGMPEIPTFSAARLTAETFDVYTGSMDFMKVSGRNLELNVNNGTNWNIPGLPEFGPAVIDWAASFETSDGAADGEYEVVTGGDPVILDYDGNQRIGVTLEYGLVSLFDFVHLEGSIGFEMGPQMLVDLGTGVPGNLGAALQTTFGDAFNALPEAVRGTAMMTNNGGTITDL